MIKSLELILRMNNKLKVLVGHINAECNQFIKQTVGLKDFQLLFGEESLDAMEIRDVFEEAGIELIPTIYARIHPTGFIEYSAFEYMVKCVLDSVSMHLDALDGIFLHLHGASGVKGLEDVSIEHYLVREIRKIVGPDLLVGVVMDPHGNITEEFCSNVNLVRCYRESPHYDFLETRRLLAKKFVELVKNKRYVSPVIRKLPIIVDGEKSVSDFEPVKTIDKLLI